MTTLVRIPLFHQCYLFESTSSLINFSRSVPSSFSSFQKMEMNPKNFGLPFLQNFLLKPLGRSFCSKEMEFVTLQEEEVVFHLNYGTITVSDRLCLILDQFLFRNINEEPFTRREFPSKMELRQTLFLTCLLNSGIILGKGFETKGPRVRWSLMRRGRGYWERKKIM